jgi:hypothetical protein
MGLLLLLVNQIRSFVEGFATRSTFASALQHDNVSLNHAKMWRNTLLMTRHFQVSTAMDLLLTVRAGGQWVVLHHWFRALGWR